METLFKKLLTEIKEKIANIEGKVFASSELKMEEYLNVLDEVYAQDSIDAVVVTEQYINQVYESTEDADYKNLLGTLLMEIDMFVDNYESEKFMIYEDLSKQFELWKKTQN